MSMQSRKVQEQLARLKKLGVLLPEDRNPLQLWLLVVMHPGDNRSGEVFVTHGQNFGKFDKRAGFEVIGHGHDRGALTSAARKLTISLGTNYQPKFSNFTALKNKQPAEIVSESQTVPTETPDDFLDSVGKAGE